MASEEKRPQFVQLPMKLFNILSERNEHPYVWLLCIYVTRWTVNWFNQPRVILSANEFRLGRFKTNGRDRYDGGMPIKSRTSVLLYLERCVEQGYLIEEASGDGLGRYAYSLHPDYHPDTCTPDVQVVEEREESPQNQQKLRKPVQEMGTPYPAGVQGPVQEVDIPPSGGGQGASRQPNQQEAPHDPIDTSLQTFKKKEIETSTSFSKKLKEENKADVAPPSPSATTPLQPSNQPQTTNTPATDEEAGPRMAEVVKQGSEEDREARERRGQIRKLEWAILEAQGKLKHMRQYHHPRWHGYTAQEWEEMISAMEAELSALEQQE